MPAKPPIASSARSHRLCMPCSESLAVTDVTDPALARGIDPPRANLQPVMHPSLPASVRPLPSPTIGQHPSSSMQPRILSPMLFDLRSAYMQPACHPSPHKHSPPVSANTHMLHSRRTHPGSMHLHTCDEPSGLIVHEPSSSHTAVQIILACCGFPVPACGVCDAVPCPPPGCMAGSV